uniref:cellulose 1,4-beta-cellobiosidase (non-reducing end) n=1 Tax=Pyrodinium bahamense TaxID=73915 RepID=A0A7S0FIM8_9DINO
MRAHVVERAARSLAMRFVLLSSCLTCCSTLEGHRYSFGEFEKAGWVNDMPGTDHGVSWTKNNSFGIKGKQRMYLLQNWMVPDWWKSEYVLFNLLGKTISFTVDLSKMPCGVVSCLYFVENWKPGPGSNYCDIQKDFGGCFELDLMEANSVAYEASLHTQSGRESDGSCNENGCSTNFGRYPFTRTGRKTKDLYGPGGHIDTTRPFRVIASITMDGYMTITLTQEGRELEVYSRNLASNGPGVSGKNAWNYDAYPEPTGVPESAASKTVEMLKNGVRLVASVWASDDTKWLDESGCGDKPHGDLNSAVVIFSDFSVKPTPTPPPTTPFMASQNGLWRLTTTLPGPQPTPPPFLPSQTTQTTLPKPTSSTSTLTTATTTSSATSSTDSTQTSTPRQTATSTNFSPQPTPSPTDLEFGDTLLGSLTDPPQEDSFHSPLARQQECTVGDKDPFSSGKKVECCEGLKKCLGNWDGARWFFKCMSEAACDALGSRSKALESKEELAAGSAGALAEGTRGAPKLEGACLLVGSTCLLALLGAALVVSRMTTAVQRARPRELHMYGTETCQRRREQSEHLMAPATSA